MKKYFFVTKLAIQDLLAYKVDFVLQSCKYSLMVLLMMVVWQAVEKNGNVGLLTEKETVSYFLLSATLYTLSNFHPWYIEEDIKQGYLAKYLVKPISPTLYYFFFELAKVGVETLLKLVIFISILFVFRLLPNLSFLNIGLLILYCPFIFLFSFQWLSLISLLTFWTSEAISVRWAVTILTRLLSGILVPLVYFPDFVKPILFWLPFEHLAYTPIQLILGKISPSVFFLSFGILCFWILGLSMFRQWCWNKGLHNFEGQGL